MTTPPEYQHPEDPDEATAALLRGPNAADVEIARWGRLAFHQVTEEESIAARAKLLDLPPYATPHVCPACGKIADPFKAGHEPGCGYGKIASKEHSREEH